MLCLQSTDTASSSMYVTGRLPQGLPAKADLGLTDLQRSRAVEQWARWQKVSAQVGYDVLCGNACFSKLLFAMGVAPSSCVTQIA